MQIRQHKLALTLWLAAMIAAVAVIAHTRFIADLSAFMPKAPSQRQQMLVDQLRDGAIARLVIVGIEGGTPVERARLSQQLTARLKTDRQFSSVQNGDPATQQRDQRYFYDNRYLLSPAVDAGRFSAAGMHRAIQDSIESIAGDAGLWTKALLPHDPTGETLAIVDQFLGDRSPRTDNDVWVSHDGRRALVMVQLNQSGLNTDAQARALATLGSTFASLPGRPAATRLVMSGTSVLSVASRDTIEQEVGRLATLGTLLVVALLLLIYRSLPLLLLGLLPVASGVLAGIAAVSLGFGHVHGLTLGFGTTLIGEAVDYSIYLFIQRTDETRQPGFWRTIRLGVTTSIVGFAALVCSSFPGLSQLGVYSISGLVTAALVTRYVLPALLPTDIRLRDLEPAGRRLGRLLDNLGKMRWMVAAATLAAVALLVLSPRDLWNRQLSALSPVSAKQSRLDSELRGDLGGNDMRYVASFTAPTEEAALALSEASVQVLNTLTRQQQIGGFHAPSQLLPSLHTQQQRRAALPDRAQAKTRLDAALTGMPLAADQLGGFLDDLETARHAPPLTRQTLAGTSTSVLLDSMLIRRANDYLVLMPLQPPDGRATLDLPRVRQALDAGTHGQVTVIDLLAETTGIFDHYTHGMLTLALAGAGAIVLLLLAACGPRRGVRVVLPLACAVVCVVGLLAACGIKLTLLHLVGLLLVVAIGSNYALFFVGEATDISAAGRRRVEVSLLVANLATVMSFGLLGTSSVPVLSYIGSTVALGALLSLLFAAMLTRQVSDADH